MTLQLYVDPGSNARMLKVDARDSGGYTYSADLKRIGGAGSAKWWSLLVSPERNPK
jgi:hypothetical protein